jgi:hypothetical protein
LFGWIASWAQALEFSTFGFYLPILFVLLGVSGILSTNFLTLGIYLRGHRLWPGLPQIMHRIGPTEAQHLRIRIVLISLLVAGTAIATNVLWIVPIAAAAMLWGHYWDAENVMTIPTMVAEPRYRGLASGFGYIRSKLPQFLGIFLFPSVFSAIAAASATYFTAIFPLIGLLAALFILPEVYGYVGGPAGRACDHALPLESQSDRRLIFFRESRCLARSSIIGRSACGASRVALINRRFAACLR